MKLNLVMLPEYKSAFIVDFIRPVFERYFEFVCYDSAADYDKRQCVFITHLTKDQGLADQLYDQGYKIAVEEIWEYPWNHERFHTITTPRWFWYQECLWNRHLEYHDYVPNKTYKKLALMPMGHRKPFRTKLLEQLSDNLDDMIWSYAVNTLYGQSLPNDCDHSLVPHWHRWFNPQWYDDTYFTLVVETMTDGDVFLTEKTFKPIAFRHPFMVAGPAYSLKHLREWGFETFENLFDESYDLIGYSWNVRSEAVIRNLKDFERRSYDPVTLEKLDHNRARFSDTRAVIDGIDRDIIFPLIELVNEA